MGNAFNTTSASSPVAGYYASQSDLESVFGTSNVAAWSDLENNTPAVADTSRVQAALDYADALINNQFRANNIATPVSTSSADFKLLTNVAARLAGAWLYESRGMRDEATDNKLAGAEKAAMRDLNWLCLPGRLDAGQSDSSPTSPVPTVV